MKTSLSFMWVIMDSINVNDCTFYFRDVYAWCFVSFINCIIHLDLIQNLIGGLKNQDELAIWNQYIDHYYLQLIVYITPLYFYTINLFSNWSLQLFLLKIHRKGKIFTDIWALWMVIYCATMVRIIHLSACKSCLGFSTSAEKAYCLCSIQHPQATFSSEFIKEFKCISQGAFSHLWWLWLYWCHLML